MEHLAWPGAVTVIVLSIFAMLLFRSELKNFFSRLHEVGWMKLLAHPPTVPQEAKEIIPKPSNVDALLKGFDNKMLVDFEDVIIEILKQNEINSSADRERYLIRHLASAWVTQFLEYVYNTIFGSQIQALQILNQNPTGLPVQLVKMWYDVGKAGLPEVYENWSFENWLNYLETSMLISVSGESVQITAFGNEFLRYLVQNQKTTAKLG